jgi:hypothetical protein
MLALTELKKIAEQKFTNLRLKRKAVFLNLRKKLEEKEIEKIKSSLDNK